MTIHVGPAETETAALAHRLAQELGPLSLPDRLRRIGATVPGRLVFTTSFGIEDQALTHAIVEAGIGATLVTLDTGRLFDETLRVWAKTELRYGIGIQGFTPDPAAVDELVAEQGLFGFRDSVAARQACCGIRKVEPLARALAGAAGWLTGLRADQSAARSATSFICFDPGYGLLKVSPLADWTREDAAAYVARHGVPSNPLHEQGFPSIGCAPCTQIGRAHV